jgi:membrane protease YdiL (CAAX protease family)
MTDEPQPLATIPQPEIAAPSSVVEVPSTAAALPVAPRGIGIKRSLLLSLLFYATFFAGCFGAGFIAGFLMAVSNGSTNLFGSGVALFLVPQIVAWIVTIRLGLRWLGMSLRDASRFAAFPWTWLPAIVVASFGASLLLAELASWIPMPEAWREATVAQRGSRVLWFALAMVVVAPIAEEIFFRGLLLRGYCEKYSVRKTIWVSAIFFALFHLNPWQAAFAFPLGVWYAWLAIRSGSVLPSMISHAVVNCGVSFLFGPLALLMGYTAEEMQNWRHYPLPMLAVGAACAICAGWIHVWQVSNLSAAAGAELLSEDPGIPDGTDNTLLG